MAALITGASISDAWLEALCHLHANDREQLHLDVSLSDPDPEHIDRRVVDALDHLLAEKGCHSVDTVANTIFPVGLVRDAPSPEVLFDRYARIYPRLRRFPDNRRGTYFGRLVAYPREAGGEPFNQLEEIIRTMKGELRRPTPLRFVYGASIFVPGTDRRPMGFPCMSALTFQVFRGDLHLTATYRNQHYIRKALGNFLGLANLHRYVAQTVGLPQGSLTVRADHAEIESTAGLRATADLIDCCRAAAESV